MVFGHFGHGDPGTHPGGSRLKGTGLILEISMKKSCFWPATLVASDTSSGFNQQRNRNSAVAK